VTGPPNTIVDCTNDYATAPDPSESELVQDAAFCPDLSVDLSRGNLPACVQGQMLTAGGAMAHALYATKWEDGRLMRPGSMSSSAGQFDGAILYARYHSVAQLFVTAFHRSSFATQMVAMFVYDLVIRILTLTGATVLFFHKSWYICHPYVAGTRGREIAIARWEWLNSETGVSSQFPVTDDDFKSKCSIPRCFSFDFYVERYISLWCRLLVITFAIVGFFFSSWLISAYNLMSSYVVINLLEDID